MLVWARSSLRPIGFCLFDSPGEAAPIATHGLFQRFPKHILTGVHGLLGARRIEALAPKSRRVDIRLRGDNHRVGCRDVLWRELVFRAD